MKKASIWFQNLSKSGKTIVVSIIAVLLFNSIGSFAQPQPAVEDQPQNPNLNTAPTSQIKIERKRITSTESIQFTSSTIEDSSLEQGITKTVIKGVNGIKTHYFDVTYTNGTETDRKEVKSELTTPVINEVIAKGTRAPAPSCPNGTYTNTYGNTVCRPAYSQSVPSGATARCIDGSYSYSQSRRGTCSHHGGVATWL